MPETAREVFMEMRGRIDHVMLTDWNSYISTLTDAYDDAFSRVVVLLDGVKAAITARQKAEQELMVGVLSVLTGGVVGVFAEGLAKSMPAVEKAASAAENGIADAVKVAAEDPVLYRIFKDTMKDAVKKGADKLQELGLDQFKSEPRGSGFEPQGMRVEAYRDLLTQGIISRGNLLWNFADALYKTADSWTPELADMIRQGLYQNDFFKQKPYRAHKDTLVKKAELALWCAWALPRDVNWWTIQENLVKYRANMEPLDWAPVRDELVELGVPEDSVTITGFQSGILFTKMVKGLDCIGFIEWVKSADMVHTLYGGISIGGLSSHHWGYTQMQQVIQMAASAA
jgi:hypothetical protein